MSFQATTTAPTLSGAVACGGFVEITPSRGQDAIEGLMYHAYRLGTHAPVTVWRNGLSLEVLEQALEPAVASLGTRRSGIRYLETQRVDVAASHAEGAEFCVLSSDALRPFLGPMARVLPIDEMTTMKEEALRR